jgi:hypothetical protein
MFRPSKWLLVVEGTMNTVLADSGSGAGGVLGGIVLLGVIIAGTFWYNSFKSKGFRPRTVVTSLPPGELRSIFERTVAGKGWSIVDDGNPIIAQSTILAGIRQEIALRTTPVDNGTRAEISVVRYSKKVFGGPTKAYTLRWRINAFLSAVQTADFKATVSG